MAQPSVFLSRVRLPTAKMAIILARRVASTPEILEPPCCACAEVRSTEPCCLLSPGCIENCGSSLIFLIVHTLLNIALHHPYSLPSFSCIGIKGYLREKFFSQWLLMMLRLTTLIQRAVFQIRDSKGADRSIWNRIRNSCQKTNI
jgi:hypothetical protein